MTDAPSTSMPAAAARSTSGQEPAARGEPKAVGWWKGPVECAGPAAGASRRYAADGVIRAMVVAPVAPMVVTTAPKSARVDTEAGWAGWRGGRQGVRQGGGAASRRAQDSSARSLGAGFARREGERRACNGEGHGADGGEEGACGEDGRGARHEELVT